MSDYYQITLLVTSEHESAIVDLYTQRSWVYRKLSAVPGQLHDVRNKEFENTPGTVLTNGQASLSDMKFFSSRSHSGGNVVLAEGLDYSLTDIDTVGDLNRNAAYAIVKTEASLVDESKYTVLETVHEIDTICTTSSHTETSESVTSPSTAIHEHIANPPMSEAKESVANLAVQSKELSDTGHILATKLKRSPALKKQNNSIPKVSDRKRSTELNINVRKRKRSCQKAILGLTVTKQLSESDIKIDTAKSDAIIETDESDIKIETEKADEETLMIQMAPCGKANRRKEKGGEGIYCSKCNFTFKRNTSYDKHILENKCTITCEICGKVFAHRLKQNYTVHMKRHNQQYDYKCEICNKQFLKKYRLLYHLQAIHNKDRQYKCENCFRTFENESTLILHKATNYSVDGKYPCQECSKVFKKGAQLGEHLKFNHLIGDDRLVPCSVCGNIYTSRYLPLHEKLYHKKTKDFKCELCPAAFVKALDLRYHMRRHTKSYQKYCETCGRGFYTKGELRAHTRTHTGEKPFGCTMCDYRCAVKANLAKHMKVHNKG